MPFKVRLFLSWFIL